MKLASFSWQGKPAIGVVVGDQVAVLSEAGFPASMRLLIEAGPEVWRQAQKAALDGRCPLAKFSEIQITAPVADPSKVVAIGLNYKDHAQEQGVPLPKAPLIFAKFPTSVCGPFDPIEWDPALTQQVDWEVELGVVIGRRTRKVSEAEALDYVFGYTVINDVSARDLQFGDKQWVRGKSLDTFCPTGPVIATADEIPNPQNLDIRCLVNGMAMQNSNTAQMVFGVRELVSYCSQAFTLLPGDLIASGTPSGVGVFRKPPVFLQDGDLVVTEVEKIGRLENRARVRSIK